MTWLFTRMEGVDTRINVRPTLCGDTSWVKPFVETMTKRKAALGYNICGAQLRCVSIY